MNRRRIRDEDLMLGTPDMARVSSRTTRRRRALASRLERDVQHRLIGAAAHAANIT
jgi:hypothetical protein